MITTITNDSYSDDSLDELTKDNASKTQPRGSKKKDSLERT